MGVWGGPVDTGVLHVKAGTFNLSQVAGTYDILTATGGNVWVEIEQVYVTTAAAGLTSALIETDHTAGAKSIVASVLLAALTADSLQTIVTSKFLLPSGKKIRGTIVGTGSGGSISVIVKYAPITAGATLV